MPTAEEVQEQLKSLDGVSKLFGRKEIRILHEVLAPEEQIEMIVQGTYESKNGVLVATEKRLVFVDKGLVSLTVEDFPYEKITSITYKKGLLLGGITIHASGNRSEISNVEKHQAQKFAEHVRHRKDAPSPSPETAPQAGPLEQLERLAALRDSGALTEEEFQAQKARLL